MTWPKDGPKTALRKMAEVGISSLMVVNPDRQLMGMVHADEAAALSDRQEKDLQTIIHEVPTVTPDTPINELFGFASYPVAVVDERQRLLGLVVRGALLAAMAERRSA